jgi:hypothetical protein
VSLSPVATVLLLASRQSFTRAHGPGPVIEVVRAGMEATVAKMRGAT